MDRRRVVITGAGAVTPLGIGAEESWQALCQGKSGVNRITRFDASSFGTQIAAEVKGFQPEDFLDSRRIRRTDLFTQYAMAAAQMAIDDAGLPISKSNAYHVGVILGTCVGGLITFARNIAAFLEGGLDSVSPFLAPMFIPNMGASEIAIAFGAKGPSRCISTACATGGHAIGDAFRFIQHGEADVMIAGGSEAGIVPIFVASLCKLKATSTRNDEPQKASRPFDRNRDGFVTGEGAGVLILEELDTARRRGAKICAELVGFGSNVDAYHATKPDYESQAWCMKLALDDAGISPREIDYINAHGTSTQLNDSAETRAIKLALGQHSKKVLVSSNKSVIGHLWGAAGAVEAVFTILTMRDSIVPPTINYEVPDPECDLDYVPNVARKAEVEFALSNSFGFGGMNSVLVFKRFHE
ncbi:MAG: beta-ketoacyl-[acyl-carrier-protein] synthase II [Dehalococcoidia bacterium]|nr:MAG: beta-ketoacyl-[acyl-carrier-protein] synthase II [Dehalococcoidia bacterium]